MSPPTKFHSFRILNLECAMTESCLYFCIYFLAEVDLPDRLSEKRKKKSRRATNSVAGLVSGQQS